MFVSTHYMEEAEYCHRLALMNRGRVIALDTPRGLRERVVEPILEVRTDDAPSAIDALMKAPGVLEAAMFGRHLHVTVEDEARGRDTVRSTLAGSGRSVEAIRLVEPSLEDVFVSLVRAVGGAAVG